MDELRTKKVGPAVVIAGMLVVAVIYLIGKAAFGGASKAIGGLFRFR